ncbi:FAD-dependent monooxygenase [Micromonospora yangpuensis]|uniref:2-polyprenyl-6-methoxyphenol hydroxylase n=1 Tax=Micromonospora yangpuensis TaxID=683228 RepID=A0A1C6UFX7_9ACTN|nr:FAD-dependent monooxygenase [Micromonospora yangpuensis]GGM05619.1 FAD-dependent oxidoreductase [Micromonospora yangpuensis]SCL52779.1 2-polyprenyl-6-methoxyphenol hydroxylase [Micromonospora yangpuensis]
MTSQTRSALVVGGGIAGPVVAMALQKAGVEATVYEAYPSPADSVGGGLSIAANGLNALDVIGVGDVVRRVGTPMRGTVMQNWAGKVLAEFSPPAHLPPAQFAWRGDLYRALSDEATRRGIRTVYGKRLVAATDTGDQVDVSFADDTRASADVLVGADGIRSTVRSLIDPGAPRPEYAGLLGFAAPVADTGLPPTRGRLHLSYGKHASCGYLVYADGAGGWFVNLPHREPMTVAQARAVPAQEWLRVLREAFRDDRSPAPELLRSSDPADLLITGPLETMPTVPTWSRGRMVLVGDAVHAASPSSGQGASIAVESAVQLGRCLRDLPYGEAFAAYERLRRERVERIINAAIRTNRNKASPVARMARDLLMPIAMKVAMRMVKPEKMAWQFEYRIDWDEPVVTPAGSAHA